jgi:glucosamine-6-phosphate deaminase
VPAEVRVFADSEALGEALAAEILEAYDRADGRRFLLGCPGGRSLLSTYRALAARGSDLDRLVIVMMDEYLTNGGAAAVDAHYSCRGFALRELVGPLRLGEDDVWLPDPADPGAYDARIADAGGVDLFLLASGATDGHVAFLPPGSPRAGRTTLVELAASTRRDNLATFPDFESVDDVPARGVSVGLATIADARSVRLVLIGAGKRDAARRLLSLDGFDASWPASIVHACEDGQILLDEAAAP